MLYNKLNLNYVPKPNFAHVYSCPGYKTKLKNYTPNIEIAYIKQGQIELEIMGAKYQVKEKSFVILPHNYDCSISAKKNEPHIHYTMSALLESESELTDLKEEEKKENIIFVPIIVPENSKTKILEESLYEAIREYQNEDKVSKIKCGAIFAQILCELSAVGKYETKKTSAKGEILDLRIKKYIEKNINGKILLADIAEALGKNANYLNDVFKKINGVSIISYINELKMKKMAILIADKGFSVKEAATQVGISDVNYASRIFKQKMGMSISEYKSASVDYTYPLETKISEKKE